MTAIEATTPMTTEQLLAMPDDGVERWLIRGQLRENRPANGQSGEKPMTVRNRWHSRIMARVTKFLDNWLDQQPTPRGSVLCGEAGVRLSHDPDTTIGIDVVYVSAEVAGRHAEDTTLIEGAPVLAVEILSPSNTQEEIDEKIEQYLAASVALIWIINPRQRTLTIYRPDQEPELVNIRRELSGDPHLPGFRVAAVELFA